VAIVARESSWVQVRSAAGDFVRTRTMEPGETLVLPDRADLALWTGNAGGLELLLDGQSVGRAGAAGAVVRDLSLAPDSLQRRQPATAAVPPAAP
jgi:cytoskeleton protein RodZ